MAPKPEDQAPIQNWEELSKALLTMQENLQTSIATSIQNLCDVLRNNQTNPRPLQQQAGGNDARNVLVNIDHQQEFHGGLRGDSLLDWIVAVEEILEFKDVPANRRVPLVATKFCDHAASWWQQLKATRIRSGREPIHTWEKLKKKLRATFLPHNYERTMYTRLQNLKQGSKSVDDYTEEFYLLLTRNDIYDTSTQIVSRFIGGLRPQIQNAVAQFDPTTVAETHRRATSFEQQLRSSSWVSTSSRSHFVDSTPASISASPHHKTDPVGAPSDGKTFDDDPTLKRPPPRLNVLRCYACGERGHRQTACPNQKKCGLIADVDAQNVDDYVS
ncbi:PREDICTED: uncharacterized protein LOC104704806 [Camelina sativa]|uniref:Uncharacterized protein LOC104704806 n=1 Tax=Camelina sativa TaxID=90675 RepID=A0ABM0T0X0_CAMSA|nr:PREDICTED: uncharacterized protein LOC104704806 [Camelina sativa]